VRERERECKWLEKRSFFICPKGAAEKEGKEYLKEEVRNLDGLG